MRLVTRVLCGFALLLSNAAFAGEINSPVGYWQTIDDVSGQPKAIIHVMENANHQIVGQIMKVYPAPGQHDLCIACVGENHNKPILGMVVMSGLKQSHHNGAWTNGEILDPKNGKTYHCNIQVSNNGLSMNVRGYIGMPLFGRTQTWLRVNNPQG